jgi:hypothetical protein
MRHEYLHIETVFVLGAPLRQAFRRSRGARRFGLPTATGGIRMPKEQVLSTRSGRNADVGRSECIAARRRNGAMLLTRRFLAINER